MADIPAPRDKAPEQSLHKDQSVLPFHEELARPSIIQQAPKSPDGAPPPPADSKKPPGDKLPPAPPIVDPKSYDYVFVGAGATGATAAAKLVDDLNKVDELRKKGFSVLVLEGGVDKPSTLSPVPVDHPQTSEDPNVLADPNRTGTGSGYWVRHFDDDKQALKDPKARADGMIWKPRGEGWGGSTRMNAEIFVRVDDRDWDKIALATGDPAFRAENMKPLLAEISKTEYRPVLNLLNKIGNTIGWDALKNLGGHGFDGPIEVSRANPKLLLQDKQIAEIAVKGLWWSLTHVGTPLEKLKRVASLFDPNDDLTQNTAGPVLVPMTVGADGKRVGARDLILNAEKQHPDQLTLQDGSRVTKIVMDDKNKVTGVQYEDAQKKIHEVHVNREAIVAAGALESSALLMRSGIGPKSELDKLRPLGIETKEILPGVGQRQGFRYEVTVTERLKKPFSLLEKLPLPVKPGDPAYKEWQEGNGGLASTNGAFLAWQARSRADLIEPDLFIFAAPGNFGGYKPGYSKDLAKDPNMLSFLVLCKNKGETNGTLELDPNNLDGAPMINHHFHQRPGDGAPVVAGIKQVREFVESQLGDLVEKEVWPGKEFKTDEQLNEKVNNESWDHHPRGGTQIGDASDSRTVIDSDFKVLGTTGLRVIDASVLPNNIGDFIVSGLYQIGDLAAKKIAADATQAPKPAEAFNPLSIIPKGAPNSVYMASVITHNSADAAEKSGLITHKQHEHLVHGTISDSDVNIAWGAINKSLDHGGTKGGDKHTVAHNLLLSIAWQVELQKRAKNGAFQTHTADELDADDPLMLNGFN